MRRALFVLGALLLTAPAVAAGDVPFKQLDPSAYQSFVANWTPAERPFCAVLRGDADWQRVLKPAPTMGRHRPFAPPLAFWRGRAVLLLARVIPAGDTGSVFSAVSVQRQRGAVELDYRFAPPPPASSSIKSYVAVAVAKPVPRLVRFRENGKIVCRVSAGRDR